MCVCVFVQGGHIKIRAPARAVYTAVISDKCTFLRGKCESFPVIVGSYGCLREH